MAEINAQYDYTGGTHIIGNPEKRPSAAQARSGKPLPACPRKGNCLRCFPNFSTVDFMVG